jgi:hypothetical protein
VAALGEQANSGAKKETVRRGEASQRKRDGTSKRTPGGDGIGTSVPTILWSQLAMRM